MLAAHRAGNPWNLLSSRRIAPVLAASVLALVISVSVQADEAHLTSPGASLAVAGSLTSPALEGVDLKGDLHKGFVSLRKGEDEQAIAHFDRVLAAADTWLAGDSRPRRCVTGGKSMASASAAHKHALVDDAVCEAHFGRGFALVDLGRGDLAEADLQAATHMAPTSTHYANEYAELFKSRRDWPRAYAEFARAWQMVDKTVGGADADLAARALRGMAYAQEKMGALGTAHALLEKSLRYEPGSAAGRIQIAYVEKLQALGS